MTADNVAPNSGPELPRRADTYAPQAAPGPVAPPDRYLHPGILDKPPSSAYWHTDASAGDALAEALHIVEVFESVGVTCFLPVFRDEDTGKVEAELTSGDGLRRDLAAHLRRNAEGRESFFVRVFQDTLIQVDDCDGAVCSRLAPFAFITVSTSPGSWHVWLCAADPEAHEAIRERLLAMLATTGANGFPPCAMRWPGSWNWKPTRRRPDGSFPQVRIASAAPGRKVSLAELEQAGLLAPPPTRPGWLRGRTVRRAVCAAGLPRLAAQQQRRNVLVLRYAGVTREAESSNPSQRFYHIRVERFAKHLAYLQRHYHVIGLAEWMAARQHGRHLPAHSVVLTFDEGFRNFMTVAWPLLVAHGFPATVFLPPARLRIGVAPLPAEWTVVDDAVYLSWAEVAALRRAGVAFGIGLLRVPDLPRPGGAVEQELRSARAVFEERLDDVAPALALRPGEYSPALAALAARLGYSCVLGCGDRGTNRIDRSSFALRRTFARQPGADDLASFAVHLSGLRRWWWRATGAHVVEL